MTNKPKKKISNIMLVVVCIMIVAYAAANFVLQYYTSIEVSPTLTTAWFAFWGTEIVALAAIKTSKVKHGQDKDYNINSNTETDFDVDMDIEE